MASGLALEAASSRPREADGCSLGKASSRAHRVSPSSPRTGGTPRGAARGGAAGAARSRSDRHPSVTQMPPVHQSDRTAARPADGHVRRRARRGTKYLGGRKRCAEKVGVLAEKMPSALARWPYVLRGWVRAPVATTQLAYHVLLPRAWASMGRHRKSWSSLARRSRGSEMPIRLSMRSNDPDQHANPHRTREPDRREHNDAWCEFGRRACSDR
jgi:hypothetical protein